MKALLIGGSGFIGKYCIKELLEHGHEVSNVDPVYYQSKLNEDKYTYYRLNVKNDIGGVFRDKDVVINFAALLGGINYFHKYPATLMLENELICASVFSQALKAYKKQSLGRLIQLSSSMVFENACTYPSVETDLLNIPPPNSVYGLQKLATEYWCKAFNEEHDLPYVIVRPFNAVGIGEDPLADSHVIPQFTYKILKSNSPLPIIGKGNQIRVYTHASDIASAIRLIVEDETIRNEDFNVSNEANEITVLDLARTIWNKIYPEIEFKYYELPDLKYDVQKRIGSSEKIRKILGWKPKVGLDKALDEVIEDMRRNINV